MTNDELENLEKLARAATPGPWRSDYCGDVWTEAEKEKVDWHDEPVFKGIGTTPRGPDNGTAKYIAAANPDTILKLIGEIRRLQVIEDLLRKGNRVNEISLLSSDRKPFEFVAEDFQGQTKNGDMLFSDYDAFIIAGAANALLRQWIEASPVAFGNRGSINSKASKAKARSGRSGIRTTRPKSPPTT